MVLAVTGGNKYLFPEGAMMDTVMEYFGREECPMSSWAFCVSENDTEMPREETLYGK